ncbi:MAG: thioredoxin [Clostridia bacterium]|nr:thioredoxin [Clostridia bacterium]
MPVLTITKDNFEKEVLGSEKKSLIDFFASWCGPCKMLSPTIEEIAKDHPEYIVGKVNIDEQPDLANKYRIMSVPTLVVFDKGQEVRRATGVAPKEALLGMLI